MTSLMIGLSDEEMRRLRDSAERSQRSVEEVARQCINAQLAREDEFREIKAYLLNKNAELYRRLAQ